MPVEAGSDSGSSGSVTEDCCGYSVEFISCWRAEVGVCGYVMDVSYL